MLKFLLILSFLIAKSSFSASNYKQIKGLKPITENVEDEGTKEITIRKRTNANYYNRDNSLFGMNPGCTWDCTYILFGYSNPIKTVVSKETFTGLEKLGFAKPNNKRMGFELMFGGKFGSPYLGYEFGVTYDFAYFKNLTKINNLDVEYEYGIQSIAPTLRIIFDAFAENNFSFYLGGEIGFSITDFIFDSKYSIAYAPKFGGLTGISYKIGKNNNYELFLGYRIFFVPKKEFTLDIQNVETKYETEFLTHNLHMGIKIKL